MRKWYFGLILFFYLQNSYANIQVSPNRAFLSRVAPNFYSTILYVANKSDKPVSYRVSLTFVKGEKNGDMTPLDDTESAKLKETLGKVVIFSPKQIVDLKPNEIQNLGFTMRPPKDLASLQDEYLAMVTFTPINTENMTDLPTSDNVATQVVVALTVRVPLRITLTSDPDYTSIIKNLSFVKKSSSEAVINFDVVNKTKFTPYGSISFMTYDDDKTKATEIATIPAIVIPEPAETAHVKYTFSENHIKGFKKKLLIKFDSFTPIKGGDKEAIIVEQSIDL